MPSPMQFTKLGARVLGESVVKVYFITGREKWPNKLVHIWDACQKPLALYDDDGKSVICVVSHWLSRSAVNDSWRAEFLLMIAGVFVR